jgi:hypothetical protein
MPHSDNGQFVAFQIDFVALQRSRDGDDVRNLVWEQLAPSPVQFFRRDLKLHSCDDLGCGQRFRVRKSILQDFYAKEVVPMRMGHVNRFQRLSA